MAISLSNLPATTPSFLISQKSNRPNISSSSFSSFKPLPTFTTTRRKQFAVTNAIEEPKSSVSEESKPEIPIPQDQGPANDELTELGSEIKKAMKEREESKAGGNFWSGVAEEIGEIEWPAFNKVLGTTGVVLGVIVGSSIVLLTVNAVLAELSDQVFAGIGFQDFFG